MEIVPTIVYQDSSVRVRVFAPNVATIPKVPRQHVSLPRGTSRNSNIESTSPPKSWRWKTLLVNTKSLHPWKAAYTQGDTIFVLCSSTEPQNVTLKCDVNIALLCQG